MASPDASAQPLASGPPHHVLILDDDPDILDLLALLLEERGYRVATALDGRLAVEAATRMAVTEGLDLALLDVSMPGLTGIEVARELRSRQECKSVRIVFHTAMPEDWVRPQFPEYDDFVGKPADMNHLMGRIEHHCRMSRAAP